ASPRGSPRASRWRGRSSAARCKPSSNTIFSRSPGVEDATDEVAREAEARAHAETRHHVAHEAPAGAGIGLGGPAAGGVGRILRLLRQGVDVSLERVDVFRHLLNEH